MNMQEAKPGTDDTDEEYRIRWNYQRQLCGLVLKIIITHSGFVYRQRLLFLVLHCFIIIVTLCVLVILVSGRDLRWIQMPFNYAN